MLLKNFFLAVILTLTASFSAFAEQKPGSDSTLPVGADSIITPIEEVVVSTDIELSKESFTIVTGSGKTEALTVEWALDYSTFAQLENKVIVIAYVTDMDYKRIEAEIEGYDWSYCEPLPISQHSFTIEELSGNETYRVKVGIADADAPHNHDTIVWSDKTKITTVRAYGFLSILILIGSLGFFIYGMKIMSEGIQKAAGDGMRRILEAMTSNRLKGIFTGFSLTTLVQSSSATTVMVVSFVNAGLLTLTQSIGVIMGANVGTTVTAWLVTLFGFKVKIAVFSLPLIGIGFPMMFSNRSKVKAFAEVIIGFALLFLGLDFLKAAVPDIKSNPEMLHFVQGFAGTGLHHTLLAVLLGTILTVTIQSSSAAMAVTLVLCNDGIIPFEMAAGMVLGENIGTTITANLAAMVGNVHAKRAARAHFIFNVFGVLWMIAVFKLVVNGIDTYMINAGMESPKTTPEARPFALSVFHTSFNIANVMLLVWFTPQIARLVTKMVSSRGDIDEEFHLEYIGGAMAPSPDLALVEAQKELAKFGVITAKMSGFTQTLLFEQHDKKRKNKMYSKLKKYEEITDRVEVEIITYLEKVSQREMSDTASMKVRGMMRIATNLERIGDIFYQMSKTIERKEDERIWFGEEQRKELTKMFKLIDEAMEIMCSNLKSPDGISLIPAREKEIEINQRRNKMRKQHLMNVGRDDYNTASGMYYTDLFSSLEKVGDHVINVSEGVVGEY